METFLNSRFNPVRNPVPPAPGLEIQFVDKDGKVKQYISAYNLLGAAVAKGQPATIDYIETYGVGAIANADTGAVFVRTAVFVRAQAAGELCWMQFGGEADALVDGTAAVVVGDALETIAAGTAFIKAASARDIASGAIALQAQAAASAVLVKVQLIPEQHANEAS